MTAKDVQRVRTFLGPSASLSDVAAVLARKESTVRWLLSAQARKDWATIYRNAPKDRKTLALVKIRMAYLILGRRPSARESGVHSAVQTEFGGYNALVQQADLPLED